LRYVEVSVTDKERSLTLSRIVERRLDEASAREAAWPRWTSAGRRLDVERMGCVSPDERLPCCRNRRREVDCAQERRFVVGRDARIEVDAVAALTTELGE